MQIQPVLPNDRSPLPAINTARSILAAALVTILVACASNEQAPEVARAPSSSPLAPPTASWGEYLSDFAQPSLHMRPKLATGQPAAPDVAYTRKLMDELKAAGFRGPVLGFGSGLGAGDDSFPPGQADSYTAALSRAHDLGMVVDMPLWAGWPLNTPSTGGDPESPNHQQELIYGKVDVFGPIPYVGPPPSANDQGFPIITSTSAGTSHNPGTLIAVVAGKVIGEGTPASRPGPSVAYQPSAGGQQFPPTHPVVSPILDVASMIDLSEEVLASGIVNFTPPDAGHWIVFAFYQRPTSQEAVNHFRAEASQAAQSDIDRDQITTRNAGMIPEGSTTFLDSLELFFAGVPWTDDFRQAFFGLHGYDVTPYLPVLFIQGAYQTPGFDPEEPLPNADYEFAGQVGQRVRHDFEAALDHLYASEHLPVFQNWAQTHGQNHRSQVSYGTRLNQVRAARVLATAGGIPDVEQLNAGDPVGRTSDNWWFAMDLYRSAASGAHQGGGLELSSENGSTFGRGGYITSLSEARALFDKQLAAGITTPILTGSWISESSAWPSSNVVFADWNYAFRPEWRMMPAMTDYWARNAQVLRTGQPQTDVAIYRDKPTTFAARLAHIPLSVLDHNVDPQLPVPVFHDGEGGTTTDFLDVRNPQPFFDTQPLEELGFSVQYLDSAGLVDDRAGGGATLYPNGPAYQALVIDERFMPGDAAQALAEAATRGLRVVIVGQPPASGAGYANAEAEDARVAAAFEQIQASPWTRTVATQADVSSALSDLGVRPRMEFSQLSPIYTQMRRTSDADIWFMWNAGSSDVTINASFATRGRPEVLDAWTGETVHLAQYRVRNSRIEMPLTLRAGETRIMAFVGNDAATATHVVETSAEEAYRTADGIEIIDREGGRVTVALNSGGEHVLELPVLPAPIVPSTWRLQVDPSNPDDSPADLTLDELQDWRDISGLAFMSGVGTYTTTVEISEDWIGSGRGAQLNLGEVCGAFEVYVNGERVRGPATPDTAYTIALPDIPRVTAALDITSKLRGGSNEIRVVVATSLANAVKGAVTNGTLAAPDGMAVPTQPYGLLGGLQIEPIARGAVHVN